VIRFSKLTNLKLLLSARFLENHYAPPNSRVSGLHPVLSPHP
jgi:hypothetical protein